MSNKVKYIVGLNIGFLSNLIGEWSADVRTLVTFIILDYVLGTLNAIVYKTSPKTEHGGVSSKIGLKGIFKKVLILSMVVVAYKIDVLLDVNFVRTGVCLTLICNEVISILETYSVSGLKTPKVIMESLELIRGKANENK